MRKRLLPLLLALTMVLSLLPVSAFAADFSDTDGHWGEAHIDRWSGYDIIEGDGDGTFRPGDDMTRAEAAQVFTKLMKLTKTGDISGFTDIPADAWYADAFAKCVAAGIMNGNGDGTMTPSGRLNREMMFTMLGRALGVQPAATSSTTFSDSGNISDWAAGYINALVNMGAINGMGDGTVAPRDDINRASVMAVMDRAIGTYVTADGTYPAPASGIILIVDGDNVSITGSVAGKYITISDAGVKLDLSGATGAARINITSQASNVSITGADPATTVNVAPEASGTTVNGNAVAAGGEYTVPEQTTSGGGTGTNPGTGPSGGDDDETDNKDKLTKEKDIDPIIKAGIDAVNEVLTEKGDYAKLENLAATDEGGTVVVTIFNGEKTILDVRSDILETLIDELTDPTNMEKVVCIYSGDPDKNAINLIELAELKAEDAKNGTSKADAKITGFVQGLDLDLTSDKIKDLDEQDFPVTVVTNEESAQKFIYTVTFHVFDPETEVMGLTVKIGEGGTITTIPAGVDPTFYLVIGDEDDLKTIVSSWTTDTDKEAVETDLFGSSDPVTVVTVEKVSFLDCGKFVVAVEYYNDAVAAAGVSDAIGLRPDVGTKTAEPVAHDKDTHEEIDIGPLYDKDTYHVETVFPGKKDDAELPEIVWLDDDIAWLALVEAEVTGLRKHYNALGDEGYWFGVAVPHVDDKLGAKFVQCWINDEDVEIMGDGDGKIYANDGETVLYDTFYFNLANKEKGENLGCIFVFFGVMDEPGTEVNVGEIYYDAAIAYVIDFSKASKATEVVATPEDGTEEGELSAKVDDGKLEAAIEGMDENEPKNVTISAVATDSAKEVKKTTVKLSTTAVGALNEVDSAKIVTNNASVTLPAKALEKIAAALDEDNDATGIAIVVNAAAGENKDLEEDTDLTDIEGVEIFEISVYLTKANKELGDRIEDIEGLEANDPIVLTLNTAKTEGVVVYVDEDADADAEPEEKYVDEENYKFDGEGHVTVEVTHLSYFAIMTRDEYNTLIGIEDPVTVTEGEIDKIITDGIKAVNDEMKTNGKSYAKLEDLTDDNTVVVTMYTGSTPLAQVKTDILDTLIEQLTDSGNMESVVSVYPGDKNDNAEKPGAIDLVALADAKEADKADNGSVAAGMITDFVGKLGLNLASGGTISALDGKDCKVTVVTKDKSGLEVTYTVKFELATGVIHKAVEAGRKEVNEEIESYAELGELTESGTDTNAYTCTVTIKQSQDGVDVKQVLEDIVNVVLPAINAQKAHIQKIVCLSDSTTADTKNTFEVAGENELTRDKLVEMVRNSGLSVEGSTGINSLSGSVTVTITLMDGTTTIAYTLTFTQEQS